MADNTGYQGNANPTDLTSEFNSLSFMIRQALLKLNTVTLVKVVSVTNAGSVAPVGFVDVHPLVHMIDGQDAPIKHGTVYGLPYVRLQGGANGIIIDPEIGDIGLCAIANRDLSKIKATKSEGVPGSNRTFNFSDGIYLGGCLNQAPAQFVQFNAAGITISSPVKVTIDAPDAEINTTTATVVASGSATVTTQALQINCPATTFSGNITVNGLITGAAGLAISGGNGSSFSGNIMQSSGTITSNGIVLDSHTHGGVQTGTGNTGAPQ